MKTALYIFVALTLTNCMDPELAGLHSTPGANPPPQQPAPAEQPPPPAADPADAPATAPATAKTPVFGSAKPIPGALKGDIYYLPTNTSKLPDFSTLTSVGSVYTRSLNIPARNFKEGFPGVTNRFEWFALRYTGKFTVTAAGTYSFRLMSDDGSKLYIDGRLVIDNDGVHAPSDASGSVNLTAGSHTIVVEYFQGPAVEIALQLFVTPPGGTESIWQAR